MQHKKTHKVYLKTMNNPTKQRSSYGMFSRYTNTRPPCNCYGLNAKFNILLMQH